MDVHCTGAAAIVEAPHAAQERLARVCTTGVGHHEGKQRVFHIREVDRNIAHTHLVGGKVDHEVVDLDDVVVAGLLARPQQVTDTHRILGIACRGADEIGDGAHRQVQVRHLALGHHEQHRGRTVGERHLDVLNLRGLNTIGLQHDKVELALENRLGEARNACKQNGDVEHRRQTTHTLVAVSRL